MSEPAGLPPGGRLADTTGLDLPGGLLTRLGRLDLWVRQVLDAATAEAGTTTADYLVLAVIRRSTDQRSAPTAICEVLGRTTGGMTLTLDRLQAAGWVRRLPDPDDRRRIVVALTPEGQTLAAGISDALHDWEASIQVTPAQRRRIDSVLELLIELIRSAAADQPRSRGASALTSRR